MTYHLARHARTPKLGAHVALAALLLTAGAVASLWPAARSVVWLVAGASVATHVGIALSVLLAVRLARAAHAPPTTPQTASSSLGQTIRWARWYDLLVPALSFGREGAFRRATLDCAGVALGERVLDVGCGTGTLALAARERVGAAGAVFGVDNGSEMVARAREKARHAGSPVSFEIAPAQALPFDAARFDVVLCTLVLHHLPAAGRAEAIAEMRRVLRPGGRLLVVDLAHAEGVWAALNPITLLHGGRAMHTAEEAEALMRDAGFVNVETGAIGSRVLGYALGHAA